jgi:hypothetical protein
MIRKNFPIVKTEDYYTCDRCKIDSLGKAMCPCPRGGCEAAITGTLTTTTEIVRSLTDEQKKWNKKNLRVVSKSEKS